MNSCCFSLRNFQAETSRIYVSKTKANICFNDMHVYGLFLNPTWYIHEPGDSLNCILLPMIALNKNEPNMEFLNYIRFMLQ